MNTRTRSQRTVARKPAVKLFTFVFPVKARFQIDAAGRPAETVDHFVQAKGVDRLSAHSNAAALLRRELNLPAGATLLGRTVTFQVGDKLPAMIGG